MDFQENQLLLLHLHLPLYNILDHHQDFLEMD
jgi:hypothetical protein